MIKAVIISDSHGDLSNVQKILKNERNLDMLIHLGDIIGQDEQLRKMCDCPVKIVRGNCDFYSDNEKAEVISIGENKIFATHGHYYSVDFGVDNLYYAAKENECNIAMYGHTHVPDISYYEGMTIVNPGSVTRPRQLNHKPTYAVLEIDKEEKTNIKINYV